MSEPNLIARRHALKTVACGFGNLAFAGLVAGRAAAASHPFAPRTPHFRPRAKRVIFIFMQGGPSHVDTFDRKPITPVPWTNRSRACSRTSSSAACTSV